MQNRPKTLGQSVRRGVEALACLKSLSIIVLGHDAVDLGSSGLSGCRRKEVSFRCQNCLIPSIALGTLTSGKTASAADL